MNQLKKDPQVKHLVFAGNENDLYDAVKSLAPRHGFQVKYFSRFSGAAEALLRILPEVILVNAENNELAGLEFCSYVKSMLQLKGTIIIFLSARKDESMEVSAFNSGADDFLAFPVMINALMSRIKTRLKDPDKSITIIPTKQELPPIKIDKESYSVAIGTHFIQLTRKEFDLLYLLASHPEKVFYREELFKAVWNKKGVSKNRTLDVHISRLRQKLGCRFISSKKGIGYRFEEV